MPPENAWKQIYSRSPVLDAGGKTGGPGENLRKQVWTGNQMHIRLRDWESNPGPLVHSAGGRTATLPASPFPENTKSLIQF